MLKHYTYLTPRKIGLTTHLSELSNNGNIIISVSNDLYSPYYANYEPLIIRKFISIINSKYSNVDSLSKLKLPSEIKNILNRISGSNGSIYIESSPYSKNDLNMRNSILYFLKMVNSYVTEYLHKDMKAHWFEIFDLILQNDTKNNHVISDTSDLMGSYNFTNELLRYSMYSNDQFKIINRIIEINERGLIDMNKTRFELNRSLLNAITNPDDKTYIGLLHNGIIRAIENDKGEISSNPIFRFNTEIIDLFKIMKKSDSFSETMVNLFTELN